MTVNADGRGMPRWPLLLIALPAFVAIWSGWVGLGRLTGFGPVALLPGIADEWIVNTAVTLPIGVEIYAAYAMFVWLAPANGRVSDRARRFACWSSIGSLGLGMTGQVAYHLMSAAGLRVAPWQITAFVACLPVVVLGCAAALVHLTHQNDAAVDSVAGEEPLVAAFPAPDPNTVDERGLSLLWETAAEATTPPAAPTAPRKSTPARRARSDFLDNPPPEAIELAQQFGKDVLRRKVLEECGVEISEHAAKELRKRYGNNGHQLVRST